jgi:hypothetical protein
LIFVDFINHAPIADLQTIARSAMTICLLRFYCEKSMPTVWLTGATPQAVRSVEPVLARF